MLNWHNLIALFPTERSACFQIVRMCVSLPVPRAFFLPSHIVIRIYSIFPCFLSWFGFWIFVIFFLEMWSSLAYLYLSTFTSLLRVFPTDADFFSHFKIDFGNFHSKIIEVCREIWLVYCFVSDQMLRDDVFGFYCILKLGNLCQMKGGKYYLTFFLAPDDSRFLYATVASQLLVIKI